MASGWRYIASRPDGKGGRTFLDYDLPLKGVSVTDAVSAPGALDGTVPVKFERLTDSKGQPILRERGTEIWAEKDGLIRGGGLLTSMTPDGPQLSLSCEGFSILPQREPYDGIYTGVEKDPLDLVRLIWNHVQTRPDLNLGVLVDSTTSPIRIGESAEDIQFETSTGEMVAFEAGPYVLNWWSTHDLGRKVDDLASETPFDFHEEVRWVGDDLELRLRLFYPRMGRRRTDLRFVLGENVQTRPSVERDSDEYANHVVVLGAGEGRRMIRAEASVRDGRLRTTKVISDKGLRSKSAAAKVANQELLGRQMLGDLSELEVLADHPHAKFGSYSVGDEISVQIKDGWTDVDLWVRILAITVRPEDSSTVTLSVERSDKM